MEKFESDKSKKNLSLMNSDTFVLKNTCLLKQVMK